MKAKAAAEPAFDQLPSNVDQPSPASSGLHLTSLWRFFLIACRSFNFFFAVVGCADSPFVQQWEKNIKRPQQLQQQQRQQPLQRQQQQQQQRQQQQQ
jgi:hypothetical protein